MKKTFYPITLLVITVISGFIFLSCKSGKNLAKKENNYPEFFKVGHRGTRGLMPENTIPSMIRAIETGANTLEVDVHITKDGKVLVYHDASFDPAYTLMPDGKEIPKDEREKYTFYQMNYADIRPFIIGAKEYPAFPQQQRISTYAPLLDELIDSVEAYTRSKNLPPVFYLVEIKSNANADGVSQPAPEEYMDRLMAVLNEKHLAHRLIVQSFDMRPLQVLHNKFPGIKLGFLTGDKNATFEDNLSKLGFTPAFYNPHYALVTPDLVRKCHEKNILIEPWTVNTIEEMKKLKAMAVDGIITDYPNLFSEL